MTYVMSDIHGNQARFEDVMRKINLQPEDTLYILGDVIDRFPDGIKMIRQFMKMPNVKMLLGNHEHMMLEALYYPIVVKKPWDTENSIVIQSLNHLRNAMLKENRDTGCVDDLLLKVMWPLSRESENYILCRLNQAVYSFIG